MSVNMPMQQSNDPDSSQQFNVPGEISHNIGGPWTPIVWQVGPDKLVNDAQTDLFQSRMDLGDALGEGNGTPNMSGAPQEANEQEQLIQPSQPPEGHGRRAQWDSTVNALRATEPLAGTVKPLSYGGGTGTPNPNA